MDIDQKIDGEDPMKVSYKERFENIKRVTQKITSSLDIGEVLEEIRDEARIIFPKAKEACLVMFDKSSNDYMRPLHCAVFKDRINCRLCKANRKIIQEAISKKSWVEGGNQPGTRNFPEIGREIAFPIYEDEEVLAVLSLITNKSTRFDKKDIALLQDLSDLATNVIKNAKRHWAMSQDKMTTDKILGHIEKFVPDSVTRIVKKNPDAPEFEKKEKDVSVLFLDLAGYTRMSQLLDKVKVNFIIEKYFSSYLDSIYKFDGDINETAGDGLMIIFQDPDPTKNAHQAIQAAIAIRERTLEINRELEGRFNPVIVNMGINSGAALVGMTRFEGSVGSRMTYTASGPVTNLAARIANAAENGEILIGPETAKRLNGSARLKDLGEKRFKNVAAPIRVYSLVPNSPKDHTAENKRSNHG
jgi:class 3 adenylate cyclase